MKSKLFLSLCLSAVLVMGCGVPKSAFGEYNISECGQGRYYGLHASVAEKTLTITDVQQGATNQVHFDEAFVFNLVSSKGGVLVYEKKDFAKIQVKLVNGKLQGEIDFADGSTDSLGAVKGGLDKLAEVAGSGLQACVDAQ